MTDEAMSLLEKQHIAREQAEFVQSVDMRYLGQEYTVRVTFEGASVDPDSVAALKQSFHQLHQQIYGHSDAAGEVEIVNLRLVGLGRLEKIAKQKSARHSEEAPQPLKTQTAIFGGQEYAAQVYERKRLLPGQSFLGPAIVEEMTATTVVPPSWRVAVDDYSNLLIEKAGAKEAGI